MFKKNDACHSIYVPLHHPPESTPLVLHFTLHSPAWTGASPC